MAVVVLADPETGFPLAILDGTHLTAMRTGAAGALAPKLLSKKEATTAGFVGCGSQARTQLMCTMCERKLKTIKVWKRHRRGAHLQMNFAVGPRKPSDCKLSLPRTLMK